MAEPDNFWDSLLQLIEEGRVVPFIGQDLLAVPGDSQSYSYYDSVARRLAERLAIPADDLPEGYDLNDVACRFLKGGGLVEDIISNLESDFGQRQ